ncbi:MAG: hypothetical protein RSB70_03065 [Clostridium sp.]
MSRGGKREGSGRKKLGRDIRIKIEESTIEDINNLSHGITQSDRIRNCINLGLKLLKQEREDTNEQY